MIYRDFVVVLHRLISGLCQGSKNWREISHSTGTEAESGLLRGPDISTLVLCAQQHGVKHGGGSQNLDNVQLKKLLSLSVHGSIT